MSGSCAPGKQREGGEAARLCARASDADETALADPVPGRVDPRWWFPSPYKNSAFPDGGGYVLIESASSAITRLMRRAGIADRRINPRLATLVRVLDALDLEVSLPELHPEPEGDGRQLS